MPINSNHKFPQSAPALPGPVSDHSLEPVGWGTMTRRSFLLGASFFLAHCASRDTTKRYREGDNSGQHTSLTPQDERKLTLEVLPQMQKDYPPLADEALQKYLQTLGQNLVTSTGLKGNPYQYNFTLVQSDQVNAFALPAGEIFVTAPLLAMCDSEAELLGVLGHEVGHVQARHTAERMEVAKKEQSQSWKYAAGGGLVGGLLGYGLGRVFCPPQDQKCLAQATQTGVAVGVGGGLLVQKYGFMQNSQEDELEADRLGYRLAYKAGYNSEYIGAFYQKLYTMEKQAKAQQGPALLMRVQDALSTHPPSQERIAQIEELKRQSPALPGHRISSQDFAQAKAKITQLLKKRS
jgi:predicted Zn-dependent protease